MTAAAYSLGVTPIPDTVDVLRAAMARHELNQRELADALGVSNETVNRWLNRRTNLDGKKLALALRKLGDDPVDYGVVEPRHKRAGLSLLSTPEALDASEPPAWFAQYVEQQAAWSQINDKLDALLARR